MEFEDDGWGVAGAGDKVKDVGKVATGAYHTAQGVGAVAQGDFAEGGKKIWEGQQEQFAGVKEVADIATKDKTPASEGDGTGGSGASDGGSGSSSSASESGSGGTSSAGGGGDGSASSGSSASPSGTNHSGRHSDASPRPHHRRVVKPSPTARAMPSAEEELHPP